MVKYGRNSGLSRNDRNVAVYLGGWMRWYAELDLAGTDAFSKKEEGSEDYTNAELDSTNAELEDKIKSLEDQISELNATLHKVNDEIDSASLRHKSINEAVIPIQNRLGRDKTTIARYNNLKKQYDTDINRLTFIVENELLVNEENANTKCPFCENNIVPHDHSSYIEASQAELVKLVTNLNELESTKIELKNRLDDDRDQVTDYKEQLDEINTLLKQQLIPQRSQISALLKNYQERIQIESALEQFKDFDSMYQEDIAEYQKVKKSEFEVFKGKCLLEIETRLRIGVGWISIIHRFNKIFTISGQGGCHRHIHNKDCCCDEI